MLRTDLVRSCSCPEIADAALRSIGCSFRSRVRDAALLCEVSPGEFAANLVKDFAVSALESDWRRLDAVMDGDDMPVLTGFRFIVEDALDGGFILAGGHINVNRFASPTLAN